MAEGHFAKPSLNIDGRGIVFEKPSPSLAFEGQIQDPRLKGHENNEGLQSLTRNSLQNMSQKCIRILNKNLYFDYV